MRGQQVVGRRGPGAVQHGVVDTWRCKHSKRDGEVGGWVCWDVWRELDHGPLWVEGLFEGRTWVPGYVDLGGWCIAESWLNEGLPKCGGWHATVWLRAWVGRGHKWTGQGHTRGWGEVWRGLHGCLVMGSA